MILLPCRRVGQHRIIDTEGAEIVVGVETDDADFIVKAVNSYHNLLMALQAIGVMPDGYCFCPINRDPKKPKQEHTGECLSACAAITRAMQPDGEG